VLAQFFNVGAFFADDHTRASGINRHFGVFRGAFDQHFGDPGGFQTVLHIFAQFQILNQFFRIFAVIKPAGVPGTVDTDAQTDWINFLTHSSNAPYSLSCLVDAVFLAAVFLAAVFFAAGLAAAFSSLAPSAFLGAAGFF